MTVADTIRRRLRAARGVEPCDLVLRNARWLDVFGCAFVSGDVAIHDGVVVGTDPGLPAKREIDLGGAHVVPGFVDAHVHLESSLLVPESFQRAVFREARPPPCAIPTSSRTSSASQASSTSSTRPSDSRSTSA